jgi:Putative beta-lactamase-inhibitor-like, PepSY-like
MTIWNRFRMGLVALTGLSVLAVAARAQEGKISPEKLPSAVRKAVDKKFPQAKYRGAAREVADGKTTYEVELTVEGRAVDAILSPEGKILEVEKEVAAADLPGPVKKALAAKYPGAKVEKAETLTKGEDGPVRYEIVINGTEVLLTAKGEIVQADGGGGEKPAAKSKKEKEEEEDDEKPSAKSKKKDKDDDR